MGAVFDRDGNFYFGLGCAAFGAVHGRPQDRQAGLRPEERRGTILKVSPDGKNREIVCTGIRFPVGLAMNEAGDLFCTDQEGATWLPGGNPIDELNHIVPGKHYGFPQGRNEKYLPDVVDEPPAAIFGPQHQSACGLIFNEVTLEARRRSARTGGRATPSSAAIRAVRSGALRWPRRTRLRRPADSSPPCAS